MSNYRYYSKVYDEVEDKPERSLNFIRKSIKKHNPNAKELLELGCGTGNVIEELEEFSVWGLELSKEMLDIAKEKLPKHQLHLGDMSDFDLDHKFDVIYSVYDTINHLIDKSLWEMTFANSAKHLKENGLFLFDINTKEKLDHLASLGYIAQKVSDGWLIINVVSEGSIYEWELYILANSGEGKLEQKKEIIKEMVLPADEVREMLRRHFEIVEVLDGNLKKLSDESRRNFYVCRKK
jgi:SAM-dependent methyltransferase